MKPDRIKLYLLSLLTGVLTGVVTLPYRYLLEQSGEFRRYVFAQPHAGWFHLLLPAGMWAAAGCIACIVKRYPAVSGSGIPQIEGAIYGRFRFTRPVRLLLAKFAGGAAGIGMGLSLGREGPSVQMGGFVARLVGKWFGADAAQQRYLYTGGASAGLASAFTAPLASSIFIVEEVAKFDSVSITITSLLAAVASAGLARLVLPGNVYASVGTEWPAETAFWQLAAALVLFSVLLAGMGMVFNRALLSFQQRYKGLRVPLAWKLLAVVVMTYLLGLFCSDLLAGGERFLLQQASPDVETGFVYLTAVILILLFYTPLCYATGFPGGIFLPLLVCGGLLGKWVSLILVQIGWLAPAHAGFFMVIGMSGLFGVVVRSPVTGIVLILEMTQKFNLIFPLIVVVTLSYFISFIANVKPIYDSLYRNLLPDRLKESDERITVSFRVSGESHWAGKRADRLMLPEGCLLREVKREGKRVRPGAYRLTAGDEVFIELYSRDLERLYRPLRSMADE